MKKVILLMSVGMLTSFGINAQDGVNQFQLGARGGVNFSTVAGDGFDSPDSRTSFYAGLVAETFITDMFALQGEVFYSGQGYDIMDNTNQSDVEYQVDYLQVPVLAKFYLTDGLNLQVGPQFGFKINEEVDFDPTSDGGDINTDAVENFDFQVATGLEYKSQGGFFVQARYSYGFSEMIEGADAHNSVIAFGAGFMF